MYTDSDAKGVTVSTKTDVPWFVAEKRARKADQIVRALQERGLGADQAARLDGDARRAVEQAAGLARPGSDATWRSVVAMLAGSRAREARCLTCGMGDPDGVTGPPMPHGHRGRCAR